MSLLTRLLPSFLNGLKITSVQPFASFHSLTADKAIQTNPGGLFNVITRSIIRIHFPRPSERKRIKKHGWDTRMKTAAGRRVLMNRILKGRFVYSH
ncbi:unnamed protein product [Psylliodes chrysocephalus]|uniref:Large ribosomal subunit protein bL34m n=1 Tax=Psylliodes chrysocephalus TaxID=3402493 RepID=A0A9P0D8I4_9CUCU|nr:unnamed protein product [Psylliodes chrysocephala]